MCAFDVNRERSEPVWSRYVEPQFAPLNLPERTINPALFHLNAAWLLDCFPETPSREIVAVYTHGPHSQSVIRIYDLHGDLLFQACHDGSEHSCHWMSEAGLLVFGGIDAPGSEASGLPASMDVYLPIVMAVRPSCGLVDRSWLNRPRVPTSSDSMAWYAALRSPVPGQHAKAAVVSKPYPGENASRLARVDVRLTPAHLAVSLLVDQQGQEIVEKRVVVDGLTSAGGRTAQVLIPFDPLVTAPADRPPSVTDQAD